MDNAKDLREIEILFNNYLKCAKAEKYRASFEDRISGSFAVDDATFTYSTIEELTDLISRTESIYTAIASDNAGDYLFIRNQASSNLEMLLKEGQFNNSSYDEGDKTYHRRILDSYLSLIEWCEKKMALKVWTSDDIMGVVTVGSGK